MESKAVDINGRPVTLKKINEGQIALLLRESRKLERGEATGKDGLAALERIDRIMRSLVVFTEDQDYLDTQMEDGKLGMKQLVQYAMSVYTDGVEPEKPKVVRRGRPTKRAS